MRRSYWWTEDGTTVAKELNAVHTSWDKWSSNPFLQAWVRNLVAYYSAVLEPGSWDTSLVFEGEQGELVKMVVPQARSLVRQFVSLVTKQRLAFNGIAESKGSDVVHETRLGNALAQQIVEAQRLNTKGSRAAEIAAVFGTAFLYPHWRSDLGSPHVVDQNGRVLYTGELEISVHRPTDVYFDFTVDEWDNLDWAEVRTQKSRWSLLAQHPELADEILALAKAKDWSSPQHSGAARSASDEDLVFVYEAYHKPTPAVPQGRMIMYSDERTIYYDGPNRYQTIPIEPLKPEPVEGMGFGYPFFSNLLPAQEMLDHSFSAIATNQSAFAVQNVTAPRSAAINVQQINGMNFISFNPVPGVPGGGEPKALQLTQSAPETFKFIDLLKSHMLELSNINSALRGQPPAGVTSGAAIATLTTNALEFMTNFSSSYNSCMERTMMHSVNAYRRFAEIPHMVRLVGKNFQAFNKPFKGEDLAPIQGYRLAVSNPLMQTIAGRSDLAEKLAAQGRIKDTQQYVSILNGDDLSTLYRTELSENDLIGSENDDLIDGTKVIALSTDDHPRHIREHGGLLNDPAIRRNNPQAQLILDHILEHKRLAEQTDPFLTAMVRTGKMPEGGAPPPSAGPGGPPEGGGPPMPGGPIESPGGEPASTPAKPADDLLGREG
jgi:hypothetical protein